MILCRCCGLSRDYIASAKLYQDENNCNFNPLLDMNFESIDELIVLADSLKSENIEIHQRIIFVKGFLNLLNFSETEFEVEKYKQTIFDCIQNIEKIKPKKQKNSFLTFGFSNSIYSELLEGFPVQKIEIPNLNSSINFFYNFFDNLKTFFNNFSKEALFLTYDLTVFKSLLARSLVWNIFKNTFLNEFSRYHFDFITEKVDIELSQLHDRQIYDFWHLLFIDDASQKYELIRFLEQTKNLLMWNISESVRFYFEFIQIHSILRYFFSLFHLDLLEEYEFSCIFW